MNMAKEAVKEGTLPVDTFRDVEDFTDLGNRVFRVCKVFPYRLGQVNVPLTGILPVEKWDTQKRVNVEIPVVFYPENNRYYIY